MEIERSSKIILFNSSFCQRRNCGHLSSITQHVLTTIKLGFIFLMPVYAPLNSTATHDGLFFSGFYPEAWGHGNPTFRPHPPSPGVLSKISLNGRNICIGKGRSLNRSEMNQSILQLLCIFDYIVYSSACIFRNQRCSFINCEHSCFTAIICFCFKEGKQRQQAKYCY